MKHVLGPAHPQAKTVHLLVCILASKGTGVEVTGKQVPAAVKAAVAAYQVLWPHCTTAALCPQVIEC